MRDARNRQVLGHDVAEIVGFVLIAHAVIDFDFGRFAVLVERWFLTER
jgi:hypothetical protein